MKRTFLYPLAVFLLVSMACAVLPGSASPTPTLPPVPTVVLPTMPAIVIPTTPALPTAVVLPTQASQQMAATATQASQPVAATATQASQPTTPPPTVAPTGSTSFTDTFDLSNTSWTDTVTATTQAKPGLVFSKIAVDNGFWVFTMLDKETYDYKFYKTAMPANVTMELKFYNTGTIPNGVALICRASSDYTSWIEFRVSSQGNYDIFHYDKSLQTQYKNPYIDYVKGSADRNVISPLPSVENDIKASCVGPNLTLIMNDKQTVTTEQNDIMSGGLVGLGVMSYDQLPVIMKIDSFTTAAK
jgi:hypothetical protein